MKKTALSAQIKESELIQRLIQGEQQAFEDVVASHHSIMLSVARAIIGEAFADEVVQDAWISAIKALPKFEGRSSLKTWLLHIVSNGAKSRLRRESRHSSLDVGWNVDDSDKFDFRGHRINDVCMWEKDTPEDLLANQQLGEVIETSFQNLPAMQRAAMTMFDLEGFKMDDICNILDISASNARVLLHRARTTIHHSIENYREN